MPRKILSSIPTPIHRRRKIILLLVDTIKLERLEAIHKALALILDLSIGNNAVEMHHCDGKEV